MWTRWPGEGSTGQARDEDGFASQLAAQPEAEAQAVPMAVEIPLGGTRTSVCS